MMRDFPSYRQSYDKALDAQSAAVTARRAAKKASSSTSTKEPRIHITGLTPAEAMAQSQSQSQSRNPTSKNPETASVLSTSTFASTISLIKHGLHRDEQKKLDKEEKRREKQARKDEARRRFEEKHPSDGMTPSRRTAEAYMIVGMLK